MRTVRGNTGHITLDSPINKIKNLVKKSVRATERPYRRGRVACVKHLEFYDLCFFIQPCRLNNFNIGIAESIIRKSRSPVFPFTTFKDIIKLIRPSTADLSYIPFAIDKFIGFYPDTCPPVSFYFQRNYSGRILSEVVDRPSCFRSSDFLNGEFLHHLYRKVLFRDKPPDRIIHNNRILPC